MRRTRNVPAATPLRILPAHASGVVTNAGRFAIIKPPMAMFSKAPSPVMSPQLCPRSVSLNETRLPGFPTLDVATDMIMKQIFTVKLHKNLRAIALCLTALPMAQAVCTPVFAADIGKSDRVADPQGNFDNARYSSSSDWKITLGVGAAYAPKYEGSDKLEAGAVPLVSIEYGDTLSIDFSGVTVNLLNHNGFRLGVKGGWEAGRKEKDDRKNLRGMGDIKAAGVVGGVIAYGVDPFEIYAKVDKTIDGSEGLTATIGASVSHKVDQFILGADLSATWADDKHMKSYFGVTSAQSARSGLRRFDAKSGFKRVDASASVTYLLTENWSITGAGGVGFLLGDAKDSPLSKKDIQPFAMVGVAYTF